MRNEQLTKDEVLRRVAEAGMEEVYNGMPKEWQGKFLRFCTGEGGLPITYDPFFKKVFDPEVHPERLSRLLSLVLGRKLKVRRALPNEGTRILDEGSLLIMDIVVEMEDGSIADVEIQKVPYLFPGERAACYSADLLMRQYVRVKGEKGKKFSYRDIKKVYTVVLLEKSDATFKAVPKVWMHRSGKDFDTGLEMELPQKYVFIALDIFHRISHNKVEGELEAWMHLLSTDNVEVLTRIAGEYHVFMEIFEEIEAFRQDIGGVLDMFSDALRILDRNTVQLMIDEMQEELEESKGKVKEQANEIEKQANEIEKQASEIEKQDDKIKQQAKVLEEKQGELEKKEERIKELENLLKELGR